MSERFFLATPPHAGRAVLAGDEARHLARVLRARAGDEVRVFDGGGSEWVARVAGVDRDRVSLDLVTEMPRLPPAARPLTLAVALPKGERQKWLVEKLTELGVARLVPLVTERGVAEATPAAIERLERGVVEACKQCGRNTLMTIEEPATIAGLAPRFPGARLLVAHPGGEPLGDAPAGMPSATVAAIGPEGGFTDAEVDLAERSGFHRVSLGPLILRVETAAIVMAARA
jgi:16S rRNA (uracil1498-N3)-methyltransferase